MKQITMLILSIFIIGCSSKETNTQSKDIQYQRFLAEKNLNNLNRELDSYEEK